MRESWSVSRLYRTAASCLCYDIRASGRADDDMTISRRAFLQLAGAAAVRPFQRNHFSRHQVEPSAACNKLAADPLRPQYHLLPAHNWMNDPNGPIFFRGRYHMFHQYNPQAAVWGNMNWAHATSPDTIHWEHEPVALSPSPNGPDRDGVFSGSAILDNGRPTVIYTGVAPPNPPSEATLRDGVHVWRETQCLAVAEDDGLRAWKKLPEPVISDPPPGLAVTGFRDPCVWREGDRWMLILGSGIQHQGGAILLYCSSDLRHWTYLHPLIEGHSTASNAVNPVDSGEMWECPDFFPLSGKHVLLVSTMGKVRWKVGAYSNERFIPENEGVVDWGAYYAAKSMLDADRNRILWGWITETRPDADLIAAGWAGALSLPRVLSLNSKNELGMEVSPAARQLRGSHAGLAAKSSASARKKTLDEVRIRDLAAELRLKIVPRSQGFSLRLQCESGEAFVNISLTNPGGSKAVRVNKINAALSGDDAQVDLHAFLDGSVLEVFIDGTTSITARIYQVPRGPLRLRLDGDADLTSLDVWDIKPISRNRLTSPLCA